jgi:hypothetical protein
MFKFKSSMMILYKFIKKSFLMREDGVINKSIMKKLKN